MSTPAAVAYDPALDSCAGGCARNDGQRVTFSWYGLTFACPGCFEQTFGAPPDPQSQPVITLTPEQVLAGQWPCAEDEPGSCGHDCDDGCYDESDDRHCSHQHCPHCGGCGCPGYCDDHQTYNLRFAETGGGDMTPGPRQPGGILAAGHLTAVPDDVTLDALALRPDDPDGMPFIAGVLSWPGYSPEQMESAWEEFAGRLRKLHALATLTAEWSEHYDEADLPGGMSHQEAAIQLAATEADDARRALRFGVGS